MLAALLYIAYGKLFPSHPPILSSEEKREQQNQIADNKAVRAAIKEYTEKKIIIKMDAQRNQVWVNPHMWSDMDVKQKQNIIRTLSKYFDYEGALANVYLYNSQTGEKIGSFSLWSGIKFY